MKRLLGIILAALVAIAFSACSTPRQPDPDYEKVHKDHKKAQKDLRKEEDQKEEDSE